jgi:hypothetical protein
MPRHWWIFAVWGDLTRKVKFTYSASQSLPEVYEADHFGKCADQLKSGKDKLLLDC